jgi:hypothetical protein
MDGLASLRPHSPDSLQPVLSDSGVLTPLYICLRGPLAVLIVLPYFSSVHTP